MKSTLTPTTIDPVAAPGGDMLQQIIDRFDNLESIVSDELDTYRGAGNRDLEQTEREMLLSVVIPVYNEEATIARVVSRVAALPLKKEIVRERVRRFARVLSTRPATSS
jgi:hypothetical protein